jgi:integrase
MAGSLHAELTAHRVEVAEPPTDGQRFIRDTLTPGLALRITARGVKSYVIECWINNRSRRVTLGKHPALSLKDARKRARQEIGKFAMGRDVAAERKGERASAVALAEVFEDYTARRDLKPGTLHDYRRIIREAFPDWQARPIASITKDMVERRNESLGARSKARASNAMRVLRALLYYAAAKYRDAEDRPIVPENPVKRLSETKTWHRVGRRTSVIKRHQLRPWLEAVMSLGEGTARDYLLFLLFTGLRRLEAARLTWANVAGNSSSRTPRTAIRTSCRCRTSWSR